MEPKAFGGTVNESARDWIKKFNNYTKLNKVEDDKLITIETLLTKLAQCWFDNSKISGHASHAVQPCVGIPVTLSGCWYILDKVTVGKELLFLGRTQENYCCYYIITNPLRFIVYICICKLVSPTAHFMLVFFSMLTYDLFMLTKVMSREDLRSTLRAVIQSVQETIKSRVSQN